MSRLSELRASLRGAVLLAPRPARGFTLSGPDARRFANGLFTNNVRDLPVGQSQQTALLDDRGRVQALATLHLLADDRLLVLPQGDVDALAARIDAFIVFDDVTLTPWSGTLVPVQGADADRHRVGLAVTHDRTGAGGFDLLDPEFLPALPALSDADEALLRVAAGLVSWPADGPPGVNRLAHELGLRDRALAFGKGCYLGQETVNRVDVMGDVKRALTVVFVEGTVGVGAEVRRGEASLGALTSPTPLDGGTLALAVLRRPFEAGEAVDVVEGDRRLPGRIGALPYPG